MAAVRERSMLALPLLLMILGNVALFVWYFQIVDFPWLQDAMLSANPAMDASAREVARGFMSKSVMLGSTVTGIVIVVPIMLLASAVYYLLFAKVVGCDIGFGKWFAFATWSAVPTLLLLPLMVFSGLGMAPGMDASWPWIVDVFGGRQTARSVHFIASGALLGFVLVHLLMLVLAGPWKLMRGMVTGWQRVEAER